MLSYSYKTIIQHYTLHINNHLSLSNFFLKHHFKYFYCLLFCAIHGEQTTNYIERSGLGVRIQPLQRSQEAAIKAYELSCPSPQAHCMLGLLACNDAYELG